MTNRDDTASTPHSMSNTPLHTTVSLTYMYELDASTVDDFCQIQVGVALDIFRQSTQLADPMVQETALASFSRCFV
jgi:hypothetical protein